MSFHHTPWIMEATAPHKDSGSLSASAGIGQITFSGRCMHSSWHPLDQSGHPSTASVSGMPAVLLITRTMNILSPGLHREWQGSEHQDCFPHLIHTTGRIKKHELFVHPHGSCSPASPPRNGAGGVCTSLTPLRHASFTFSILGSSACSPFAWAWFLLPRPFCLFSDLPGHRQY